jgi:hypothetical protein
VESLLLNHSEILCLAIPGPLCVNMGIWGSERKIISK